MHYYFREIPENYHTFASTVISQKMLLMVEIRQAPVDMVNIPHYSYGFINPKWCKISSINSRSHLMPLKINMEHNHGGLEDHVPFQMGDL